MPFSRNLDKAVTVVRNPASEITRKDLDIKEYVGVSPLEEYCEDLPCLGMVCRTRDEYSIRNIPAS